MAKTNDGLEEEAAGLTEADVDDVPSYYCRPIHS